MYTIKPIGYMKSPFTFKNGTPRQQSICQQAKGIITIEKNIFNNPEHSLEGLEEFSHVWIFFVFHKNNNVHTKAKVKPPRLNGKKTGVFSTRSPYRPNNIGLTLAKIEDISGASLTVSGIDILDGTPIVDIKPYIPQYDYPINTEHCRETDVIHDDMTDTETIDTDIDADIYTSGDANNDTAGDAKVDTADDAKIVTLGDADIDTAGDTKNNTAGDVISTVVNSLDESMTNECKTTGDDEVINEHESHDSTTSHCKTSNDHQNMVSGSAGNIDNSYNTSCTLCMDEKTDAPSQNNHHKSNRLKKDLLNDSSDEIDKLNAHGNCLTAEWLSQASVTKLAVRWTPSAEEQLKHFSNKAINNDYRLNFSKTYDEAKMAIMNILHEDPRSTYRRKHCVDQLYYFTYDIIHVTCWFDENIVEIVRVKPVNHVDKLCGRG
ncbi:hypothetical protein ACF0H5_000354 [Mactra antiquata]